jgi:hypothetical protein
MTNTIRDTATISPALMPKKVDPAKRRGRAYGLGERNPDTLPSAGHGRENDRENDYGTRRWATLRKLVQSRASDRALAKAARH